MRALYAVEGQGSNASVEDRLRLRQEQSASVLAELREKHFDWREQLLPKHPMAEAIKNALGHWEELNVFVADGAVAIDNNVSEREMKRIVLNRKKGLFVGNERGGRNGAIPASLTSSCRCHDVDPQIYLTHPTADQLVVAADERLAGRATRQMEGHTECETGRRCP